MIVGEAQNLAAMKELLTSWQVEILYDVFKEEDITINELKIMEFKHVNNLLQNYKTGVRIRFEYNFNNWRNKIGLPLKPNNCCCRHNANEYNDGCHNMENTIAKTKNSTNNNFITGTKRKRHHSNVPVDCADFKETQPLLSPQSVKSENGMVNISSSKEMLNKSFATLVRTESPNYPMHNTDDEGELDNSNVKDSSQKFLSKETPLERFSANLAEILQSSGSRGLSIVEFYKNKNYLTNNHRIQLIQTIVDFFDENNYHMSLNTSHNLEWEILKMFPTEKLENYRTKKLGKLYVKFSNMKRYKRERQRTGTHSKNNDNNDQSINRQMHANEESINRQTYANDESKNNDESIDEIGMPQTHVNDELINPPTCSGNNDESTDEIGMQLNATEYNWSAITEPEIIVKEEPVVENEEIPE